MRRMTWCAVLGLAALAGCWSDNGLNMGRVHGTVTFKGAPIEDGQILYSPDDTKGTVGVPAMAKIASDGSYTLSTQEPGDGAIVGHHKVGIRGLDPESIAAAGKASSPSAGKDIFAARSKAARGGRRAKALEGPNATVTIGGTAYKLTTPAKLGNPNESGIAVDVARGSNRIDFDIQEDGTVKISR